MIAPGLEVIRLLDVSRRFTTPAEDVWAVRGVDLTVQAGELVAVLGASGSGKSTLLGLIAGLDLPTQGEVEVLGQSLADLGVAGRAALRLRSVGVVFQDDNVIDELRARENVALPLEALGASTREALVAADEALEIVGLGELVHRYPAELSGGQRQRVGIARAIVGQRRVILADEPTGALDRDNTHSLFSLLRERCDAGLAVIVATHDWSIRQFADRTLTITDGVLGADDALAHAR